MSDRRTDLMDAGLRVLASSGMRGLTHRAVDAEAGLPMGSATYYFRSRAELVRGCTDRLLEFERAPLLSETDSTAEDIVDAVVRSVVSMLGEERVRTLARLELTLAAVHDEELRVTMRERGALAEKWRKQMLASHGIATPEAASELGAVVDGLVVTALLLGPDEPDAIAQWARPVIRAVIDRYVPDDPQHASCSLHPHLR